MASFTYETVVAYIERVQKESYCMTMAYSHDVEDEEWYVKSLENGASYTSYSHPIIPYITQRLEDDNTALLNFLVSVFATRPSWRDQEDNEQMCKIAKEMYDKL